jgi:hypothetical protein
MLDAERKVTVAGGADVGGIPFSSDRGVGGKDADEDVGVASILCGKSSSEGSDENDNGSDCEDFPPENFPPGGLDYDDGLEDAVVSIMEEVVSEDDDLILSILLALDAGGAPVITGFTVVKP